ncbi:MAG: hypothetical protein NT136_02225 [Candidatus Moranbacteria bacterium]|nr:hypothetical protein [Candidatus Moranbacteria bacterium]
MGSGPERHHKIDLIEDLEKVYKEKGRIPRATDLMEAHQKGKCVSYTVYCRRFGNFKNAIRQLEKKLGRNPSDQAKLF